MCVRFVWEEFKWNSTQCYTDLRPVSKLNAGMDLKTNLHICDAHSVVLRNMGKYSKQVNADKW